MAESHSEQDKKWFKKYLIFQAIFGSTFAGSSFYYFEKHKALIKYLLIAYEIIINTTVLLFLISNNSEEDFIIKSTTKKLGFYLVLRGIVKLEVILFFVLKFVTLINGQKILKIIDSFDIKNDFKISLKIFTMVCLTGLIRIVAQNYWYLAGKMNVKDNLLFLLGYSFSSFVTALSMVSIIAMLMYSSEVVVQNINNLTKQIKLSTKKIGLIGNEIMLIKEKIQDLNNCLGIAVLCMILFFGISSSGLVCLIVENILERQESFTSKQISIIICSILLVIDACVSLIYICNSSQNMISSFERLINQLQWKMSVEPMKYYEYEKVKLIFTLKKSFCFKASNFFTVRNQTLLVILSQIGTYSVIFIQTEMQ